MPQLEEWGPYVPGYVGGYFRDVQAWKNVSHIYLTCPILPTDSMSQYAVKIIQQCRVRGTSTPFLRNVLGGEKDAYLGRTLTDSELAEECMGGM